MKRPSVTDERYWKFGVFDKIKYSTEMESYCDYLEVKMKNQTIIQPKDNCACCGKPRGKSESTSYCQECNDDREF